MERPRILLIDDSRFIGTLIESELEEKGFDVTVADTGRGGLDLAKLMTPDLIILDLILPDISGENVCKEIKRDPRLCDVPVVMLTAKDSDTDKVVGRVIGAAAYIPKPFEVDKLIIEINKLIGK